MRLLMNKTPGKDGPALLSYIERHDTSARDEAARQSPHFEWREVLRGGPHQNDVRSSMEVLTTQGHKLGVLINHVRLARAAVRPLEQAVELEVEQHPTTAPSSALCR